MSKHYNSTHVGAGKFSVRGFRPQRQWEVDCDYLHRLAPEERAWMQRFLSERYDADNKLLRPQHHYAKCPRCRQGGDCGRRPPPTPIHNSDEMRRECYRLQKAAYEDVYSRGRVSLWADFDTVDESGTAGRVRRLGRGEELRSRSEAGDYLEAGDYSETIVGARRRRK